MINFIYLILTIYRILKYLISNTKRYSNILLLILFYRPKSIIEIGVYRGVRSKQMIQAARIFNKNIEYFGFDLFEMIDSNIQKKELSKIPNSEKDTLKNLSKYAKVKLFKGYTTKTLDKLKNKKVDLILFSTSFATLITKSFIILISASVETNGIIISGMIVDKLKNKKVDLIFIDGGHKLSTIKNDWTKSKKFQKKNTIIIFDDYYLHDKKIIKHFGCNLVINKISEKKYLKKFCFFVDNFIHLKKKLCIKMIFLKKLNDD